MNTVLGIMLSPFVRKVLLTLEYKNIPYDNKAVMPGSNSPKFRAISPLGKIPAFQDDYISLADSSIICQYLNDKHPTPSIYPSCPIEKARALWLEEFADSRLIELLGGGLFYELVVAPKLLNRPTDTAKVVAAKKNLPPLLDYLEKQIQGSSFLIGNQLSIADLSLPSMFVNAGYAGYHVDAHRWPKLANYLKGMFDHPLYQYRLEQEAPIAKDLSN